MQIAPHPVTVHIVQDWNWTDVASVALTAALVLVALVEITRARAAERERRRSVDQRISSMAYALQRQVTSWVIESPLFGAEIRKPTAAEVLSWAERIQMHFSVAEERITQMISLAPDASRKTSAGMRSVYVKFYRATDVINQACAYKDAMADAASEQVAIGWTELRDCLAALNQVLDLALVLEANRQFEEVHRRLNRTK